MNDYDNPEQGPVDLPDPTPIPVPLGEIVVPDEIIEVAQKDSVAGDNTRIEDNDIIAALYGRIERLGNKISVRPLLTVSDDKLTATLDLVTHSFRNQPLTTEHVLQTLAELGIVEGIDREAINEALGTSQLSNGDNPPKQLIVARGVPAKPAVAARYEFNFPQSDDGSDKALSQRHRHAVKRGEWLCRELPGQAAVEGRDVFGQAVKISAAGEKSEPRPIAGKHVKWEEETGEFISSLKGWGYVQYQKGVIQVVPPITVADDHMHAYLTLYPPTIDQSLPGLTEIKQLLNDAGVNYGVDDTAINAVLTELRENATAVTDREIARGQEPLPGKNAYLEYQVDLEQKAGKLLDDGRIDFHERNTIINVKAGASIATRVAPTPGRAGVTVLGETIPASSGEDVLFKAGQQCELKADTFYATEDGAVMVKDNAVHVTDSYQISGDVDLSTGNLEQAKGGIEITGSVQAGLQVKAASHIQVRQNVENAKLIAGGDIAIDGGVVQPEGSDGFVYAFGNVSVKFSQNAHIYSYQSITINGSAMSSQLHAKENIKALNGKGCIIGGTTKAGKSIHAKQIGSEAGAVTHVEIVMDPKISKKLNAELEEARQQEDTKRVDELLKEQRLRHEKYRKEASIVIEGPLYPGVVVKILDTSKTIEQEIRHSKITLSAGKKIIITAL